MYKLNNTLKIYHNDGRIEEIKCSSISFQGRSWGLLSYDSNEKLSVFGANSVILMIDLSTIKRFDFTDLPNERVSIEKNVNEVIGCQQEQA